MRPRGEAESTSLRLWLISVSLSDVMACRRRDMGQAYSKPMCGPGGVVNSIFNNAGEGRESFGKERGTYHQYH